MALTANGHVGRRLALIGLGYGVGQFSIEEVDLYYNFGNPRVGPEPDRLDHRRQPAGPAVIAFNAMSRRRWSEALVRTVGFANFWTSPGNPQRAVTFTLSNGAGETSIPVVATIDVTDVFDPAVANDDVFVTGRERRAAATCLPTTATATTSTRDGGTIQVTEVNGSAALVGTTITLASGALLTVNANGTFTYNPNGAFSSLVPGRPAPRTSRQRQLQLHHHRRRDRHRLGHPERRGLGRRHLQGRRGGNAITGTALADYFDLSQGGNDTVFGLASNDAFYFGAAFTGADTVDGGAGTNDQIGLEGNYTGANALVLRARDDHQRRGDRAAARVRLRRHHGRRQRARWRDADGVRRQPRRGRQPDLRRLGRERRRVQGVRRAGDRPRHHRRGQRRDLLRARASSIRRTTGSTAAPGQRPAGARRRLRAHARRHGDPEHRRDRAAAGDRRARRPRRLRPGARRHADRRRRRR